MRNGIVTDEWELAQAPICVEPFAQVQYKNGISVVSELEKLVFTQIGQSLTTDVVSVVEMAQRYVAAVPHVDYRGLGINPKGDIAFQTEEDARKYIMGALVAPGHWQSYGLAPVKASITFVFQLAKAKMFLIVQEARLNRPEGVSYPVITFAANFHHDLNFSVREEMMSALDNALANWQDCWKEYVSLISTVFNPKEL